MNPYTNKFEPLVTEEEKKREWELRKAFDEQWGNMVEAGARLLRPDGTPVPKNWSIFQAGENVVVKDYTFKVAHIGESYLVLEPVGPIEIGKTGK